MDIVGVDDMVGVIVIEGETVGVIEGITQVLHCM